LSYRRNTATSWSFKKKKKIGSALLFPANAGPKGGKKKAGEDELRKKKGEIANPVTGARDDRNSYLEPKGLSSMEG